MRTQFATVFLALAAPLHAIKVTSPSKNDVVDPSKGVTVEWETVGTDPARAHLVLSNMAGGHTPFSKDFGEVDLSKGSFTVTEADVPSDEGYQFNFESTEKLNTGILAQSEQFEVEASEGDDEEKTTSSSSSSSATKISATATSSTSASVKTSTLTSTFTSGSSTITSTATTLETVSSKSATGTDSEEEATKTGSSSTTASTGAAVPTGVAMQAGGLFALVAGVAAVMA